MASHIDELEQLNELGRKFEPSARARESARAMVLSAVEEWQVNAPRRRSRWKTPRGLALAATLIAVPGAVAIASTLNGDVSDNYSGFLTGTGDVPSPGRAVETSDNAPGAFAPDHDAPESLAPDFADVRVLASNGSHHLFAARDADGAVHFRLDSGPEFVSTGANPWLNQFSGNAIVPLFASDPELGDDREAVAGLTASDVASVELRYTSGPPDVIPDPEGAFVFLAAVGNPEIVGGILQVDRKPVQVVAMDENGEELQQASVTCLAGSVVTVVRPAGAGTPDLGAAGC